MNYIGINALNHEASVSVVRSDGEILFASMTERYSGKKNDTLLDRGLMQSLFDRYNPQKLFGMKIQQRLISERELLERK